MSKIDRQITASQNKLDRLRGRLDSIQWEIYKEAINYGRLLEQDQLQNDRPSLLSPER